VPADVHAEVEKTQRTGGEILADLFDVPGTGRIAIVRYPTGAMVGVITEAAPCEETMSDG
jgi:predicted enzyme related to lactoylglutathione lyase